MKFANSSNDPLVAPLMWLDSCSKTIISAKSILQVSISQEHANVSPMLWNQWTAPLSWWQIWLLWNPYSSNIRRDVLLPTVTYSELKDWGGHRVNFLHRTSHMFSKNVKITRWTVTQIRLPWNPYSSIIRRNVLLQTVTYSELKDWGGHRMKFLHRTSHIAHHTNDEKSFSWLSFRLIFEAKLDTFFNDFICLTVWSHSFPFHSTIIKMELSMWYRTQATRGLLLHL